MEEHGETRNDRESLGRAAARALTGPVRASGLNLVVADNVTRLRLEQGLSQAELARRSGMTRISIVGIEKGTRIVGLNDVPRLAFGLQVPLSKLLAGDADQPVEEDMTLGQARHLLMPTVVIKRAPETVESLIRRIVRDELNQALR